MHRYGLILIIALLIAGCSGGGNPVTPGQGTASLDSVPVIDLSQTDDTFNAIGLMGAYEVIINPDDMTADLVAKRTSAIGEGYIVSGIGFFTMAPCSNCLTLTGFALDGMDTVILAFDISHPFQPGNLADPPSAANRRDLDVFDLAMVIVPQEGTADNYPLTGVDAYAYMCVDADGYTRELQNVIGDNAALPYFLVIDDSAEGTSTWNKFAMGASAAFEVKFALIGPLRFDMYLTMGYGASARRAQRLTPKYYNPEFNRNAAWKIDVIPPGPAEIGSIWDDNDATTEYDVEVHVYDWQQGATVYAGEDFGEAPESNIYASSDVASVSVEIPGMTSTLPTETVAVSGTGMPDDPLVYMFPIANENLLEPGLYPGLVKVTDERAPGAIGERDFMIDTPDGILLNNYVLPEYATYQVFMAEVILGCGPITGEILDPAVPITGQANNATIDFTVLAESDNDGDPIVLYEVDYDYDGDTFNASDSNTDGIFTGVGPFTVPDPCEDNVPADFTVAFRATDSCDPPNVTIFATTTVTVENCVEAVGTVAITVNRLALANRYAVDRTRPWTLSWDAAAGAAEYAIYCDFDPSDGLGNNYQFVGATTATEFDVPTDHVPANSNVVGNTYIVRSRGTVGDAGSEVGDSEQAFITFNSFETGSNNTAIWNSEGWYRSCEGTNDWYYSSVLHQTGSTRTPYGNLAARYSPFVGGGYMTYGGRWQGIVKETPEVPNSTVRYMESANWFQQVRSTSGMFYGTVSSQPPQYGFTDTESITWASVRDDGDFQGYNYGSSDVRNTVSGVPASGNVAWNSIGDMSSNNFYLWGGDLNVDGDPDDPFVTIYHVILPSTSQNFSRVDEIAIVIY